MCPGRKYSGRSAVIILLYSHNDINNNNTGQLCRFGCEHVYFFQTSVLCDTRWETQTIKAYANHTMLTLIRAQRILWCLRSHLISTGRDLNWSALQFRKTQSRASTVETQLMSFQNIKNLWTISSTTLSIHSDGRSTPFPVWGFMTDDDCHILPARV